MKTRKKQGKTGKEWARYCLTISSVKNLPVANRGLLQAAGSWSVDACCAVADNSCYCGQDTTFGDYCHDQTSSSDWLFGLGPGPPQRFEPTGTDTYYQYVGADFWPCWGNGGNLVIGDSGAPGGSYGTCQQGTCQPGTCQPGTSLLDTRQLDTSQLGTSQPATCHRASYPQSTTLLAL